MRYGYRRVHVLLQRDGWTINVKRVYLLYRELSLQLRNKTPKRRVKAKLREDRTQARQINETWAISRTTTGLSWPSTPALNPGKSRGFTASPMSMIG